MKLFKTGDQMNVMAEKEYKLLRKLEKLTHSQNHLGGKSPSQMIVRGLDYSSATDRKLCCSSSYGVCKCLDGAENKPQLGFH